MRSLQLLPSREMVLGLLLTGCILGCTPQKKADKVYKPIAVPRRLQEVYKISKQTSYALFDCDTTINEIRVWKSFSRITSTTALFLKAHTVSMHEFYMTTKNDDKKKVIAVISQQEEIKDPFAERTASMFTTSGATGLTSHEGIIAAIDSLLKLGFRNMQSQTEKEDYTIGDGTSYIIEVRQGSYYKYVYYHNPELFNNESAHNFIKVYQFLTKERWHNSEFDHSTK